MVITIKDKRGEYLFDVYCDYIEKDIETQVDESLEIYDIISRGNNLQDPEGYFAEISILNIIKWANKLDDVEQMCLDYIKGKK